MSREVGERVLSAHFFLPHLALYKKKESTYLVNEEGCGGLRFDAGGHPSEHVAVHGVGAGSVRLQSLGGGRRVQPAHVRVGALRVRELEGVEAKRPAPLVERSGDAVLVPERGLIAGLVDGNAVPEELDPPGHELVDLSHAQRETSNMRLQVRQSMATTNIVVGLLQNAERQIRQRTWQK